MKTIEVVAAIIRKRDRVFATQRGGQLHAQERPSFLNGYQGKESLYDSKRGHSRGDGNHAQRSESGRSHPAQCGRF